MTRIKKPLTEDLGESYMNEFFRGSLFRKDNKVCMIQSCSDKEIVVRTINSEDKEYVWVTEALPSSILTSFKDVAWPKLGYRNYKHTMLGNVVSFISSQRTVLRGIRVDHLDYNPLPVCNSCGVVTFSGAGAGSDKYRLVQLFFPSFYTYKEGMNKIKENKIPAFALNEDVAIGLSLEPGSDRFCDIHFRNKIVGNISTSGQIMIANKVMKKRNISQLCQMMEQ